MGNAPAPRKAEQVPRGDRAGLRHGQHRPALVPGRGPQPAEAGRAGEEGVLREISRFDLYAKMLYLLRACPFKTAHVMDARWRHDRPMAVADAGTASSLRHQRGGRFQWLHPGRMQLGWMADELLFYHGGHACLARGLTT